MKRKRITKTVSFLLIVVTLAFILPNPARAEEAEQTIGTLFEWYTDSERTTDTFTLTNDIYCSSLLLSATDWGGRTDSEQLTIDTGECSLVFNSPAGRYFTAYINDKNLTIRGNSTNGCVVMNRGKLRFSSGSIVADGPGATGVRLNAASVVEPYDRVSAENAFLSATGEGAAAVRIAADNSKITLNGMIISGSGGAAAIDSFSPFTAIYCHVDGMTNMNGISGNRIASVYSQFSDQTDQKDLDNQSYTLQYENEIISFGDLPATESITVYDSTKRNRGRYMAPIQWEPQRVGEGETGLEIVTGSIDAIVAPIEKKAYVYHAQNAPDCSQETLLSWYNKPHEAGDTYVLSGDIFITDIDVLGETQVPITIDTGDYSLFIQNNLAIQNPNLTITGKGESLGVVCVQNMSQFSMPGGGRIEAKSGTALCVQNNLLLGGSPIITAAGGPCVRVIGVDKFLISGAILSGDAAVQVPGTVTFVDCRLTGTIDASEWFYAVSDVPEGNETRNVYSGYSFHVTSFENSAAIAGELFDVETLPKTYPVKVKLKSGLVIDVKIPIIWESEALAQMDTAKAGTYRIDGELKNLGGEDFSDAQPTIMVDIIDPDKLTILGTGGVVGDQFYRYKDIRLYFKLEPGVPVVSGDTFYIIEYSPVAIVEGVVPGAIAPSTNSQEIKQNWQGYWPDMIRFPLDGYGCIVLSKSSDYGMLDKDTYCFRLKTAYFIQQDEERVGQKYYTDTSWFPYMPDPEADNGSDTQYNPPPSTTPSDDNSGTRGGGERDDGNKPTSQTFNQKQIETIIASGEQKIPIILGDVTVIVPALVMRNLSGNAAISAKQTAENGFLFTVTNNSMNVKTLTNPVALVMPCTLPGNKDNTIAKINGKVIKNGYFDEKTNRFIANVFETGTITFETAATVTFPDTEDHWAARAISFLAIRGIKQGDAAGQYRPNDLISKDEFAALLDDCLPYDKSINLGGADKGKITRAEIAVMLYRAYGADGRYNGADFGDLENQSAYVRNAIAYVNSRGYMTGVGRNRFSPNTYLDKAEAAQILYNLISGS